MSVHSWTTCWALGLLGLILAAGGVGRPSSSAAILQEAQQGPAVNTFTISGSVRSRDSGRPYPNATVSILPSEFSVLDLARPVQTKTDGNGRFLFTGVASGQYSLRAFSDQISSSQGSPKTVTVKEGVTAADVSLWIDGIAKISGRILAEDGQPLSGAYVALYSRVQDAGGQIHATNILPAARSDDVGRYTIFTRRGEYYLWARAPAGPADSDLELASVYYPGVANIEQAVTIEAREDVELAGLDLRMGDIPRFRVQFYLPLPELKALGSPAGPLPICYDRVNGRLQRRDCAANEIPLVQAGLRHLSGTIDLPEQSLKLESLKDDLYRTPPLVPAPTTL